jgi:hypothetical protein
MTKELCRVAESENPHDIYEPIELLYLPDWERHPETIVQAFRELLNYSRSDPNTTKRSPFYAHNNFSTTTLINLY